jgi:hypothetical protein
MQQDFVAKMREKVKKRNVHAGPKQTAKCNKRRHRELSSQHALEVSNRRARVAELAASGKDLRQCEELLKQEGFLHTDHSTLSRDLRQARAELNQSTQATLQQDRDQMRKNLLALVVKVNERDFRTGWDDPSCTRDLLAIYAQLSKLLGLNADTRVSVVAVNNDGIPPEKMIPWRRWLWETRHVPDSSLDQIWELCKKLSEPGTPEALMNPPADSPLWHDDYEDDKGEPN